jgi:hypothetical protein
MSADEKDDATKPIVDDQTADGQIAVEPAVDPAADPAVEPAADPAVDPAAEPAPSATAPTAPSAAWPTAYRPDAYGTERATRPSIRWGGVVWGAILVVFAATMLWVVSARPRVLGAEAWLATLSPASAWTLAFVAAGVIILILALLAVVRSAQRKRRA